MALYTEPCLYCQRRDDSDDALSTYAICDLLDGKQCKPCKQALELDKEITRTRIMLDALLSRKQKLHTEINQSHDRMIQRFPAEILSYIFLHSLSEEEEMSSIQSVTTPFILGGVCQAWRKVAWASPNLWTRINIFVKPGYNLDTLEIAHEWLLRSGELPLSIFLVSSLKYDGSGGPIEKFRSKLSGFMQRYISRCWNLRIHCHQQFMPSFSGVAPILEKLELSSAYEAPPAVSIYLISLRSLRSEGIRLCLSEYRLVSLDIDWGSITTFEGSISANDFSEILQRAPRLRLCNLTGLPAYTSFAGEQYSLLSRTITPQSMTSLSLKRSPEDKHPTAMLLTTLKIPTLTHLTMSEVPASHLERFIQRSGCSLIYLSLDRIDCPADTDLGTSIFGAIPTLEELHINADNPSIYEFFSRLSSTCVPEKDKKVMFLPCLRVLDIWFSVETGFSWRHVASILGSPSDLSNPMRRPIAHFCVAYDWHMNKSAVRPIDVGGISPSHLLEEHITRSFLAIAESGVDLELYDVHRGCDLLQQNMEYHGILIPAWYKTTGRPSTYHTTSHYSEMDAINELDSQFDLEYSDEDSSDSEDRGLEDDEDDDDGGSDTDISDSSYNYAHGLPNRITGETSELLSDT